MVCVQWCGLKYGVGADGNPNSEKPEDIDVIADWIKPGMSGLFLLGFKRIKVN